MASDIWLRTILIVRKEGRKEGNVLFKDALNTFYLRLYGIWLRTILIVEKREREMFYLTTHSTHFILRLYGVRHMVKDHSDSEIERNVFI